MKKLPTKLAKKRQPRVYGLLAENNPELKSKLIVNEHLGLLDLLCEYYDIEDDEKKYLGLAYCLAYDHIPGFQTISIQKGAHKWSKEVEALLIVDIETLIEKPSKGVSYVSKLLAKKSRWSAFFNDYNTDNCSSLDKKSETLRKRYYKAKKKKDVIKEVNEFIGFKNLIGKEAYKELIFSDS